MNGQKNNVPDSSENGYVEDIPLDQILEDPYNIRTNFDEDKIAELALSIREQGLQQLPYVNFAYEKDSKKYYYLKAGARRLRAHRKLGRASMVCFVRGTYVAKKSVRRRLEQGAENSVREPQTHSEMIALVEDVLIEELNTKEHGAVNRAVTRVSAAFGKSASWAGNYRTLVGLLPELRLMLDDNSYGNGLDFHLALSLAGSPKDVQHGLLEESKKIDDIKIRRSYVSRKAREIRAKRGEKIKNRSAEELRSFLGMPEKLLKVVMHFGESRTGPELNNYIDVNLSRVNDFVSVDEMLSSLEQVKQFIEWLEVPIKKKRDSLKKPLRRVS